jgi:teichuronic acid biosynthesis glycosyltransferase TuaC
MRVLVLSNMRPDRSHPERGQFVRDQVAALRDIGGLQVDLHQLPPGAQELLHGFRALRRAYAGEHLDVVHSHFSLTALPALGLRSRARGLTLHGTDVRNPRTRLVTRAVLPLMDLIVAVSAPLAAELPGSRPRSRARVIPCGVDLERFKPMPRAIARAELGLPAEQAQLLFAADPSRPGKRFELAQALSEAVGVPLLTLGGVDPQRVPLMINASNAVLIPSIAEGFGLAVLEALACDVPVLATPVGVHPLALAGVEGTLCADFDLRGWRDALAPHLAAADPRVRGRKRAEEYSSRRMAKALADAWRELLG